MPIGISHGVMASIKSAGVFTARHTTVLLGRLRGRVRLGFSASRRGASLIEVVVSLALIGVAVGAFAMALDASALAQGNVSDNSDGLNLARSQMENVKLQSWSEPPNYTTIPPPPGYAVSISASSITPDVLQRITVSVYTRGKEVAQITGYKVNVYH